MKLLIVIIYQLAVGTMTWGADECPYTRYCMNHTICSPPKKCEFTSNLVAQEHIDTILKRHNELRSRVATGKETKADNDGTLPTAADMLQMVWDEELAKIAQVLVEGCKLKHDCGCCRYSKNFNTVGQNLYISYVTGNNASGDWVNAIEHWYGEVRRFHISSVSQYHTYYDSEQFTQIVWAESWRVGCGHVTFPSNLPIDGSSNLMGLFVCNYGKGGNFLREKVYTSGDTCSKCPENTCCGDKCSSLPNYPGLCKVALEERPLYNDISTSEWSYYCNINSVSTCKFSTPDGMKEWTAHHSLSEGPYVEVVLEGGETSVVNFTQPFKQESDRCVSFDTKCGHTIYMSGRSTRCVVTVLFRPTGSGEAVVHQLHNIGAYLWNTHMTISINAEILFSLTVSIPADSPTCFFALYSLSVKSGKC